MIRWLIDGHFCEDAIVTVTNQKKDCNNTIFELVDFFLTGLVCFFNIFPNKCWQKKIYSFKDCVSNSLLKKRELGFVDASKVRTVRTFFHFLNPDRFSFFSGSEWDLFKIAASYLF